MELFSRRRRRLISAQVVSCSGMYNTKTLCYTCMATFHSCLTIGSIQIKILPNCNFLLVQISHQIPPTKPFWKDILLQFILLHMTEASCWLGRDDPITGITVRAEIKTSYWKGVGSHSENTFAGLIRNFTCSSSSSSRRWQLTDCQICDDGKDEKFDQTHFQNFVGWKI